MTTLSPLSQLTSVNSIVVRSNYAMNFWVVPAITSLVPSNPKLPRKWMYRLSKNPWEWSGRCAKSISTEELINFLPRRCRRLLWSNSREMKLIMMKWEKLMVMMMVTLVMKEKRKKRCNKNSNKPPSNNLMNQASQKLLQMHNSIYPIVLTIKAISNSPISNGKRKILTIS